MGLGLVNKDLKKISMWSKNWSWPWRVI